MPKVFSTTDENNGYNNMPVNWCINSGDDANQLYVPEGFEPHNLIGEGKELKVVSSVQTVEIPPLGPKHTVVSQHLPVPKHQRYRSKVKISGLSPEGETQNTSNNPETSSLVTHNKAPDSDADQALKSHLFNLKDSERHGLSQRQEINLHSASGYLSEKIVDYQKSTTQRADFNLPESDSPNIHRTYPARSDDVALLKLDSDQTLDGTDSQEDEIQPIQYKNSSASESVSLTDIVADTPCPDVWADPFSATTAFTPGKATPMDERNTDSDAPNRTQYSDGILSSLAKLYSIPLDNTPNISDMPSSLVTSQVPEILGPKKSIGSCHSRTHIQDGLPSVVESRAAFDEPMKKRSLNKGNRRDLIRRLSSATLTDMAKIKLSSRPKLEEEVKITVHIAETQSRQNYLLKLCDALIAFGAPTHRLEEYMRMSARVLEVQGSFLYIPGCMIISFDDVKTHTNDVKLVKTVPGLNLGLLVDVHEIYKEVVHDIISVEEATQRLDKINDGNPIYNPWVVVVFYGFASAFVAPWAFQGRYIDMPITFLLGSIVGFLQHVIAPKCDLYNNVFEIAATVITSFLARAFGSIHNGNVFCFSALAQSSLALILPGYIILCGCLEMQSKSLIAGGVRMVYGIIYSFFLGFGISVGTAFYGLLDPNATNATTCNAILSDHQKWVFVPFFAVFAALVFQARLNQLPLMMIIGFAGYIVNFLTFKRFPYSAQISNTLGAFTVGLMGNFYARVQHGVAAAALIPGLFVLVPSGIAASGSLLAGLSSADKITTGTSIINGTSIVAITPAEDLNKIVFNVGNTMVQIAIGLTVGLFLSTLLVYPFGKRRSGLFTF